MHHCGINFFYSYYDHEDANFGLSNLRHVHSKDSRHGNDWPTYAFFTCSCLKQMICTVADASIYPHVAIRIMKMLITFAIARLCVFVT